jgi:hypothetical protein
MGKRVNISLSDEQIEMVREFKGIMGNSDSEIIRNILLAWFNEQGIINKAYHKKPKNETNNNTCILSKIKKVGE